jgi:hypothetical protein
LSRKERTGTVKVVAMVMPPPVPPPPPPPPPPPLRCTRALPVSTTESRSKRTHCPSLKRAEEGSTLATSGRRFKTWHFVLKNRRGSVSMPPWLPPDIHGHRILCRKKKKKTSLMSNDSQFTAAVNNKSIA